MVQALVDRRGAQCGPDARVAVGGSMQAGRFQPYAILIQNNSDKGAVGMLAASDDHGHLLVVQLDEGARRA